MLHHRRQTPPQIHCNGGIHLLKRVLHRCRGTQLLQLLQAEPRIQAQGGQHLQPTVRQMVVGVKDATGQLDQLAVITQQQQIFHACFRSSHQHRSDPVAHLEQRRQSFPPRQVQTVFTDHQRQGSFKPRIGR